MKLYQICEFYCDYEDNYLIVSNKQPDEIKKVIYDNDINNWLYHVDVREINQVDGYQIILKKII